MISDEIIKEEFIRRELTAGAEKIRSLQRDVVQQVLSERTGRLLASLSDRKFHLQGDGEHFMLSVSILNYLRFNEIRSDMTARRKLHLYNRIVWGVLYGETLPALKFGITDELREQIRQELQDNGVQLEINF